MTRVLRVTAYTDANFVGGAEISLGHLLETLDDRIDVALLGTDEEVLRALASRRPNTPIRLVPPVRSKRDLRAIGAHIRAVRELRPNILHAQLRTPWTCQYGILAGILVPGVRVIAVEQLPMPSLDRRQRRFKRLLSRRLAAHVAVGLRAAREVESFAGLPPYSVRTIYNGVPEAARAAARATAAPPVIGSLGRLDPQKGFDLLMRALPSLPEARVQIVGEGPERGTLEQLARELGVDDRVELVGWHEDARRFLASFDVFALPSRYEGFPLAVVEAMLAGVPVVAADVGSVSEAVHHEQTGMLVPPDNLKALTDAIERLLADTELRSRLGANARKLALERFTVSAMTRAFEELYGEVSA